MIKKFFPYSGSRSKLPTELICFSPKSGGQGTLFYLATEEVCYLTCLKFQTQNKKTITLFHTSLHLTGRKILASPH
jgi:hypothetical protein